MNRRDDSSAIAMSPQRPLRLATRGSPLALAQAQQVLSRFRTVFPHLTFEIRIIKTTGDRLQHAAMPQAPGSLPKGLFTKEIEAALLRNEADLAVHSLKDLPTEIPPSLALAAVLEREDARDVLVCRLEHAARVGSAPTPACALDILASETTIATGSPRRREQLLALRPDLRVVAIRGNLNTRLDKLARDPLLAATLLAAAGLHRLGYRLQPNGSIQGPPDRPVPPGLAAAFLPIELMIPCVGQAAIGIEVRADDEAAQALCRRINHPPTLACVTAERAFLRSMGGGCLSPVAAYAEAASGVLKLRGVSFRGGAAAHATLAGPVNAPEALGRRLASELM